MVSSNSHPNSDASLHINKSAQITKNAQIVTHKKDINMDDVTHFLLELDALKHVNRRSYVTGGKTGADRLENAAEHSWHLAMACWSIAEQFKLDVDHEKLLKMALVHDLGEIDAGDTFLYATSRGEAHIDEREGIARLQSERGNGIENLSEIWEAQETGVSAEVQLIKVVDRLLPLLLNINTEGRTWLDLGIKRSQVENAHAFIADSFPMIHDWITQQIDVAVGQGWLIDK